MIREHDRVVLTADVPEEALVAGDVGTVVHLWKAGDREGSNLPQAYEVEFFTVTGKTAAVATVPAGSLRAVTVTDRLHVRVAA